MAELNGNLLVAQSGGPTCSINASLAGVVFEAGKHECIGEIYGGVNGILGVLEEDLIDLNEEKNRTIDGLKHTPGAALGTCRYKIDFQKNPDQAGRDLERLFAVFQAHDIRYVFYTGGNDSADTAHKLHEEAVKRGYELRVISIPKTIDNDLAQTDHCPGYGSVIKYAAITVREVALDIASMATDEGACCIIEVMGRSAGWIAAGTVLAQKQPLDAPHLVLLPEIPFNEAAVLAKIRETIAACKYCIVVVGEGLKNAQGQEIGVDPARLDAFGHPLLSGAAERLAEIVSAQLKVKTRTVKLGYAQRAAAHCASTTDIAESVACGEAAVKAAVAGQSGMMVKLIRRQNSPYECATEVHPLGEVANVEHRVPRDWMRDDGFLPNEKFLEYARPLIEGELQIPYEGGLPKYATLERTPVEKKLPPRQ